MIVVDNASGDVLAYVGGVGGASSASNVDNAGAPRQAGSTLKPFLYEQAIERGFLTPASILDDSPVQLHPSSGPYVPRDYDESFKGPVSVRTALAGSLNVPAVRALLLDGVETFRDRRWDLGYRGLTEDGDYYGYSLALGSAEVTLLEQAAAFRALADGGRWRPLRLRAGDPIGAARQAMAPAAAWIVADMLADADARAVTFGVDSALRLPFWAAAKTGTSKAMRDNWCIGFSDRFTVAVWIGNAEGDSMARVSGTSGAAPVWRELMLALHRGAPGRSPPRPPGSRPARCASPARRSRRGASISSPAPRRRASPPPLPRRGARGSSRRSPAASMRSIRTSRPRASGSGSRRRERPPASGCASTDAISAPPRRARSCCRGRACSGSRWSVATGGRSIRSASPSLIRVGANVIRVSACVGTAELRIRRARHAGQNAEILAHQADRL